VVFLVLGQIQYHSQIFKISVFLIPQDVHSTLKTLPKILLYFKVHEYIKYMRWHFFRSDCTPLLKTTSERSLVHITLQLIHIPIIHKTQLLYTFFPGNNYRQLPWSWAFFEMFQTMSLSFSPLLATSTTNSNVLS